MAMRDRPVELPLPGLGVPPVSRPVRGALLEVLSDLPRGVAHRLDEPEVAQAVDELLARGWRPAQLGARIGVLPASDDPVPQVVSFLRALAGQDSPEQRALRERELREHAAQDARAAAPEPASDEARERWLAEVRRGLKGTPRRRLPPPERVRPACSLCAGEGRFFVTREVHLCGRCVEVMGAGGAQLEPGQQVQERDAG